MVFSRVGSGNGDDQSTLEWLQEQASKGEISDEEFQEALSEYTESVKEAAAPKSFEAIREQYKREKSRDNFESGVGGFKRST